MADMDRDSRIILLALITVLGIAALGVVAAMLVPFNVDRPVMVLRASGEIEEIVPGRPASLLKEGDTPEIKPGQGLQLGPESSATLSFDLNQGRAILDGPAALTVIASYRRATLPGHAVESFEREYVLTLEQTSGTVHYNFANTDPPLDEIDFTLQLPDQNYIPSTPCWIAIISAEGTTSIQTIDCSS